MKKGFTLIELLAVIVILAIIALIATPIVLNIINNAKTSSSERSIDLYKEALQNAVAQYQLHNPSHALLGTYSTTIDGKQIYLKSDATKTPLSNFKIDYSGSKVTCDKVKIGSDGKVTINNCKVNDVLIESTKGVVSFTADSWDTISDAVKSGEANEIYKVGDTKEVDLGTYGKHTVRIANMSTPSSCSTEGYSQTACGFVVEFADIITNHIMNPSGTYDGTSYYYGYNKGGYPGSQMYLFLQNDIFKSLPVSLKDVIIPTTVVSSYGSLDSKNFTSTDKLYLLASKEIWGFNSYGDKSGATSRQLDYYKSIGVTDILYSGATKKGLYWWVRTADCHDNSFFYCADNSGRFAVQGASADIGVSPAFRIG